MPLLSSPLSRGLSKLLSARYILYMKCLISAYYDESCLNALNMGQQSDTELLSDLLNAKLDFKAMVKNGKIDCPVALLSMIYSWCVFFLIAVCGMINTLFVF